MIWTRLFPSVRKTERERFTFFFLLSGFLILGQTLGLVGAESLLLAELGADVLPVAFILASVVTVVLSLLYAFGVDRAKNDIYFIRILLLFAGSISVITWTASHSEALKSASLIALFCLYYANFAICTNHFWTFTADFFELCKNHGLIVGKGGLFGSVIRIKPPMCLTTEDVDFLLEVLDRCFVETAGE